MSKIGGVSFFMATYKEKELRKWNKKVQKIEAEEREKEHKELIEEVKLLAIWALKKMGISDRLIGELFTHEHHTITAYYKRACEKISRGELPISPYKWRGLCGGQETYIGSSRDVEGRYAKLHQRPTGGGWRTPKRSGSDDIV